jgi:hypothetical protein
MKEILASIGMFIGSLFGVPSEEPEKPVQELEQRGSIIAPKETWEAQEGFKQATEPQVKAGETEQTTTPPEEESTPEEPKYVTDGDTDYEVPKDAPWWAPIRGGETISENIEQGEDGYVSTIAGNGVREQNETSMASPRKLAIDSKGHIWYTDGNQKTAKLRVFDGKKNRTVVDLVDNKLIDKDGQFMVSGLGIIQDNVYISNEKDLYKEQGGHLVQVDFDIKHYMQNHNAEYIYRMRVYKDEIYLMLLGKSRLYQFAKYSPKTGEITQITEPRPYAAPYNFFVHEDNEIMIATELGYVVWEQLNPRRTEQIDFGDHQFKVLDVWVDNNRNLYMVTCEEQVKCHVYMDPPGNGFDDTQIIAGGRRGFVDGYMHEVEMDYPMDFVWDGSGYIFGDTGNNSIRKLWWSKAPSDES